MGLMNYDACAQLIEEYSENTDANQHSKPTLKKKLNIIFFEAIIALKLFTTGNSCDFAICFVCFVCLFFDIKKWDF